MSDLYSPYIFVEDTPQDLSIQEVVEKLSHLNREILLFRWMPDGRFVCLKSRKNKIALGLLNAEEADYLIKCGLMVQYPNRSFWSIAINILDVKKEQVKMKMLNSFK
jgi:hypothetical protein